MSADERLTGPTRRRLGWSPGGELRFWGSLLDSRDVGVGYSVVREVIGGGVIPRVQSSGRAAELESGADLANPSYLSDNCFGYTGVEARRVPLGKHRVQD